MDFSSSDYSYWLFARVWLLPLVCLYILSSVYSSSSFINLFASLACYSRRIRINMTLRGI